MSAVPSPADLDLEDDGIAGQGAQAGLVEMEHALIRLLLVYEELRTA